MSVHEVFVHHFRLARRGEEMAHFLFLLCFCIAKRPFVPSGDERPWPSAVPPAFAPDGAHSWPITEATRPALLHFSGGSSREKAQTPACGWIAAPHPLLARHFKRRTARSLLFTEKFYHKSRAGATGNCKKVRFSEGSAQVRRDPLVQSLRICLPGCDGNEHLGQLAGRK